MHRFVHLPIGMFCQVLIRNYESQMIWQNEEKKNYCCHEMLRRIFKFYLFAEKNKVKYSAHIFS